MAKIANQEEQALIRFLKVKSYPSEIREHDWDELLLWEGVGSCWLAVKTIISCVLNHHSPLCAKAQTWLKGQKDNPLVLAVVLHEAGLSRENRGRVYNEIIDHLRIVLSPEGQKIWWAAGDGHQTSWSEIVKAVGLQKWQAMPPAKWLDLFASCRRIMENPTPDTIVRRIINLLENPKIERMPALRRALIEKLLVVNNLGAVLGELRTRFDLFADDILNVLINPPDLYSDASVAVGCQYYDNLFSLGRFFAEQLLPLRDPDGKIISKLLELHRRPWVWATTLLFMEQVIDKEKFAQYLFRWYGTQYDSDYLCRVSHGDVKKHFRRLINATCQVFCDVLCELPAETAARLLGLMFAEGRDIRYLPTEFQILMRNAEEAYIKQLAPIIQSGKIGTENLLFCLNELGIESFLGDVQSWLNQYSRHMDEKDLRTLGTDYIIPNNLSAGGLIFANAEALFRLGYQLKAVDVSHPSKLKAVLGLDTDRMKCGHPFVWANASWSSIVLESGVDAKMILQSLFITAEDHWGHRGLERVQDISQILGPYQARPEYQQALCEIAWDIKHPYNFGLARLYLYQDNRWKDWQGQDEARAKEFIHTHYLVMAQREKTVLDTLVTLEEQRALFFESALAEAAQSYSKTTSLLPPGVFSPLFADDNSKERLTKWLITNLKSIEAVSFLQWVAYYDLLSSKTILKIVRGFLDHWDSSVAKEALKILKTIKS